MKFLLLTSLLLAGAQLQAAPDWISAAGECKFEQKQINFTLKKIQDPTSRFGVVLENADYPELTNVYVQDLQRNILLVIRGEDFDTRLMLARDDIENGKLLQFGAYSKKIGSWISCRIFLSAKSSVNQ